MSDGDFPLDLDVLLATTVRLLAAKGAAREVALLAAAEVDTCTHSAESDFGWTTDFWWGLWLKLPPHVFGRLLKEERQDIEARIHTAVKNALLSSGGVRVSEVTLAPQLVHDDAWKEKAVAWLRGEGINNQGRVRSDNIATRECDGLLFRSQAEIWLYRALKRRGVTFLPLPVAVRGGETYRRIEPDFLVIKDGTILAIEVDGDTVHHETPLEAHTRTAMLVHEGAQLERVSAEDCSTDETATACADRLLAVIDKHALAR